MPAKLRSAPNLCSPALFTPFGCVIFANILHSIQFGPNFVALFFFINFKCALLIWSMMGAHALTWWSTRARAQRIHTGDFNKWLLSCRSLAVIKLFFAAGHLSSRLFDFPAPHALYFAFFTTTRTQQETGWEIIYKPLRISLSAFAVAAEAIHSLFLHAVPIELEKSAKRVITARGQHEMTAATLSVKRFIPSPTHERTLFPGRSL
jgi:hypothetical protein